VEDLLSTAISATSYNAAIALDSSPEEAATARSGAKIQFNGQNKPGTLPRLVRIHNSGG